GDPDDQPPFAIHQTHWRSTSFDAVWKVQQITRSRPDQPLLSAFEEKYRVVLYFGSSCCARSSMDRASVFGTEGWGFDSLRARWPMNKGRLLAALSCFWRLPLSRAACCRVTVQVTGSAAASG